MDDVSRQLVRALRGNRSQVQLSRRLGYQSNVLADWEGGHRAPAAAELFRVADVVGVDARLCRERFAGLPRDDPRAHGLREWLEHLRGRTSVATVAERTGVSRNRVGRWLRGDTQPRLPDFLRLIDALTGRVHDLVAELVPIADVPALYARWRAAELAQEVAWREPWAVAMYALAEGGVPVDGAVRYLARRFGHPASEVRHRLERLAQAGLVEEVDGTWVAVESPSMNVSPGEQAAFRKFWVDHARSQHGGPADHSRFNLFGCARADLARIREIQDAAFQQVRSLVAASAPVETVGLVVWQTCELVDVAEDEGAP